MTKYCVNCKHFSPKDGDEFHQYARCSVGFGSNSISPVTGLPKYVDHFLLPYCEVMRTSASKDKCGEEGQFYEENTNV